MTRATNIAGDIVLHGKTTKEHDRNLVALLNRLFCKRETILSLNNDKCKIGTSEIVFKELILNKHDVGPTEEKVKDIGETKAPTNLAELRSFLGFVSFSVWFLLDFATTVESLRNLNHKSTKWQWGKEENEALKALRNPV